MSEALSIIHQHQYILHYVPIKNLVSFLHQSIEKPHFFSFSSFLSCFQGHLHVHWCRVTCWLIGKHPKSSAEEKVQPPGFTVEE